MSLFDARRCRTIDNEAICAEPADDYIDAVPWLDDAAFVGEHHPILPAIERVGCLAELAHFFHGGNLHDIAGGFIEQMRLEFLVVESFGFVLVNHAVAKAEKFARRSGAYFQVVYAPEAQQVGIAVLAVGADR